MLPVAQWYAAITGPSLVVSHAPRPTLIGRRSSLVRFLGYGLIRLGRALSRRPARSARLAPGGLVR